MAKSNAKRLSVSKTYKMYVDGKFPRTESGRSYQPSDVAVPVNVCWGSRKDLRNAVVAARAAQPGWAARSAYNRSQILYRVAEMLEGRQSQFVEELELQGSTAAAARAEVEATIDCWVYYAGWCDKYQQVFSSVNPVASSHFNFTALEAIGVVAYLTQGNSALLGPSAWLAPIIASGNTVVAVAPESRPLSLVTLGEVLATSDVPGGVVNILTGHVAELLPIAASHLDINALALDGIAANLRKQTELAAAEGLKRIRAGSPGDDAERESPYRITAFCEWKTTWHPIENISSSGPSY